MVASSSTAPSSQKDLEEELIDYGVRLFTPPSSNDELLSVLDKVESLLVRVGQAPSETMRNSLHPIMKALIGSELIGHSDEGVKVSVVLCLSEIMRITAPQQPYDDAVMKEIFQHILEMFEKLSQVKSHCYLKAVQILDNVSKVRACVMLLDLECDALVTDIIKLFLRIIRSSHANDVFTNMEDIMTWIIKECDEVSGELLMPLLDSIKNENQTVSPVSWKLGRNVLEKCSAIVRPWVVQAVKSMSLEIDGYAGILASICHEVPEGEDMMEKENGPLAAQPVEVVSGVPPVLQQDVSPTSIDISNKNRESENSSKTSQDCHQIEHPKDTDIPTSPNHHSLEDSTLPRKRGRKSMRKRVKSNDHCKSKVSKESSLLSEDGKQTAPVVLSPEHPASTSSKDIDNNDGSLEDITLPRKRGRKTLRKHDNNNDHCKSKGNQSYFELPHDVKEHEINFLNSSYNPVAKESSLLSEDGKQTVPVMLSPEHPASTSSKDIDNNDGTFRKRGRPKKNQLDLSLEKGYEGATAQAKPKRGSRKKESIVQYNAEKSLSSNVVIKKEEGILSADMSSLHLNDNLSKKTAKTNCLGKENFGNQEDTEKIAVNKAAHGEELVGAKIRVWWPMDKTFYEGEISSYDPVKKKHEVVYADGDVENLNLAKERWEMLKEIPPNEDHEAADTPVSSAKDGRKKRKGESSSKQKPATKRSRRKVQQCGGSKTVKTPKVADFWVADKVDDKTTMQGGQPSNNENNLALEEVASESPVIVG